MTLFPGCNLSASTSSWHLGYKDFWFEVTEGSDDKPKDEYFESERGLAKRIAKFLMAHDGTVCLLRVESVSQTLFTLKDLDQNVDNAPNIVEKARGVDDTDYSKSKLHTDIWTTAFRVWFVTTDEQLFRDSMSDEIQQAVSPATALTCGFLFSLIGLIFPLLF